MLLNYAQLNITANEKHFFTQFSRSVLKISFFLLYNVVKCNTAALITSNNIIIKSKALQNSYSPYLDKLRQIVCNKHTRAYIVYLSINDA